MLISLNNAVLLQVIETLQRRYWYTHYLWGQCLNRIQDKLHQRRQAGRIDIDIDEIFAELDSTIETVRNETFTEADIIDIAQQAFDENDRIWPDGFYIDRLLRQFGINTEAIPAPEGERYIPPRGLAFWPDIFVPSSFHRRLDTMVFKLFEEIHELLDFQSQAEDDIRELGPVEPERFLDLDFLARDYLVYDRMARLVRLDGNGQLLQTMIELVGALELEMQENLNQT